MALASRTSRTIWVGVQGQLVAGQRDDGLRRDSTGKSMSVSWRPSLILPVPGLIERERRPAARPWPGSRHCSARPAGRCADRCRRACAGSSRVAVAPARASVARESRRVLNVRVASRTSGTFSESTSTSSISLAAGATPACSAPNRGSSRAMAAVLNFPSRERSCCLCTASKIASASGSARREVDVQGARGHPDGVHVTADPGHVRGRRPQHVVGVAVGHRGLVGQVLQRGARPGDVGASHLAREHGGRRVLARCSASAVRDAW